MQFIFMFYLVVKLHQRLLSIFYNRLWPGSMEKVSGDLRHTTVQDGQRGI